MQRRVEYGSIAVFALLVALESWQLAVAAGAWLPLVLVAAPLAWLAMDLLSGLVHFACDSFGSVHTPLVGRGFIQPFREHHLEPEAMTRHDFVETHGNSCLAALPLLATSRAIPAEGASLIALDAVLLFTALGALASNQCHKWAHMDQASVPRLVRWLQRRGFVLSPETHRRHHTAPFDSHFCIAAGWLNRPMNALLRALR